MKLYCDFYGNLILLFAIKKRNFKLNKFKMLNIKGYSKTICFGTFSQIKLFLLQKSKKYNRKKILKVHIKTIKYCVF